MNDSPTPPPAIDPVATAKAQQQSNAETARLQANLNRVNQVGPTGSVTYTTDPNNPDQYTQTTKLNSTLQSALDKAQGTQADLTGIAKSLTGQVASNYANPIDYSSFTTVDPVDQAGRQQVADSVYNQMKSRLDPQWQTQKDQLDAQLANQGIMPGTQAYNNAIDAFSRSKNDAYQTALNNSIQSGGAEQSRLFGIQSTDRQRQIAEALQKQGMPLSQIAQLLSTASGGNAAVQGPNAAPIGQTQVAPTNTYLPYALQNQQYQTEAQTAAANNGALFGLGGSLLSGAGQWASGGFKLPSWGAAAA